jgi:hypothetical protein
MRLCRKGSDADSPGAQMQLWFSRNTHQNHYSLKPFSPSLVAMSLWSTELTLAADGPLFKCCTNWFKALCSP